MAVLNLTSMKWKSYDLPRENGVVFNDDWQYERLFYISKDDRVNDTSHLYAVCTYSRVRLIDQYKVALLTDWFCYPK